MNNNNNNNNNKNIKNKKGNNDHKRKNNDNKNKRRRKKIYKKNDNATTNNNLNDPLSSNIIIRFPPLLMNESDQALEKLPTIDHISKYFDNVKEDDLILVEKEINTIEDLIDLGKSYKIEDTNKYTLDMETLNKLVEPLEKLQKMIGEYQ